MTWTDKLPEIIIGSVLIAGGGYLINQLIVVNKTLGGLEAELKAKLAESSGRIDRIAAALPDLRIRIAKEELAKPTTAIVVATVPVKNDKGKWSKNVSIVDTESKKIYAYVLPASGPEDDVVEWQVVGKTVMHDREATSVENLSRLAKDVEGTATPPSYVNQQASYFVRAPNYPFAAANKYLKSHAIQSNVYTLPQGGYAYSQFVPQLTRDRVLYFSGHGYSIVPPPAPPNRQMPDGMQGQYHQQFQNPQQPR